MLYDIVINNGMIIEPKSETQTVGNIGILDGKIAAVNRLQMEGKTVLDAKGRIVCPGFVDIHSHLSKSLYSVWLSAKQGITTCLSGNCGLTPVMPVKDYLDELEKKGYPINFATLAGHSWTFREMAGIKDPHAAASPEQIKEMAKLAEESLEEGAFGISFGIEYAPGATQEEIIPLAAIAAKYDKLVTIHTRRDSLDFAQGLYEAIEISEITGARVQISHLAYQFGVHEGVMRMALCMIDHAIEKKLPILCDSGVYEAFATFVKSAVFDDGWHLRYGCRISDLMISTGKYAGQRATLEMIDDIKSNEEGTVGTAFVGVIPDLALAISRPYTMISTDAGLSDKPGNGHPQDIGTFPRLFQKYVREQGALSMMEAVKKSSYMPAKQMGIDGQKGWIGVGADADIVVFDPMTIKDNADYVGIGQPDAPPNGVEYVIVNGVVIVAGGNAFEDRLPGKILRQPNREWSL